MIVKKTIIIFQNMYSVKTQKIFLFHGTCRGICVVVCTSGAWGRGGEWYSSFELFSVNLLGCPVLGFSDVSCCAVEGNHMFCMDDI